MGHEQGPGVLQRRLLTQLEAAEGKVQSASELLAAILLEDFPEGAIAALAAARTNTEAPRPPHGCRPALSAETSASRGRA